MRHRALVLAGAAALLSLSGHAHAEGATFELALGGGLATNPAPGINPVGAGIAGRLGVSYQGVYFGADIAQYSYGTAGSFQEYESISALTGGVELGYGFTLRDRWILRPALGVGMAGVTTSPTSSSPDYAKSSFSILLYVGPAFTALLLLEPFFVGADLGAPVFFPGYPGQGPLAAFVLHGQVGVRF